MRSRMIGTLLAVVVTAGSAAAFTLLPACGSDGGDPVLRGVSAIVFAKRKFVREDGTHDSGGAGQVLDLHPNTLRSRMKKLGIVRGSHELS